MLFLTGKPYICSRLSQIIRSPACQAFPVWLSTCLLSSAKKNKIFRFAIYSEIKIEIKNIN